MSRGIKSLLEFWSMLLGILVLAGISCIGKYGLIVSLSILMILLLGILSFVVYYVAMHDYS